MVTTQVVTIVLLAAIAGILVFFVLEMRRMRWRSGVGPWDLPYHGIPLIKLSEIIDRAARRSQINLSWGARQMLIIPVVETIELEGEVNWGDVERSIDDVVRTIAEPPNMSLRPGRLASSVAVIQSFFQRFCNIPPFCSRRQEQPK
jgi:hypothetical protein